MDCLLFRETQRFLAEEVSVHPDWASTSGREGDIALIRLDRHVTTVLEGERISHLSFSFYKWRCFSADIDSTVLPICLDGSMGPNSTSLDSLRVMGWGKATNADLSDVEAFRLLGVSERTMQKLEVPLVGFARCRAHFKKVTKKHICAGGEQGKAIHNTGNTVGRGSN